MSIAAQLSAGIDQSMTLLGDDAVFCRVDTGATVSVRAIVKAPQHLVTADGETEVVTSFERWDILIRAADLIFGGVQYEPQPGDTVTVLTRAYTALLAEGNKACWTWADHDFIRRRVYTKLTSR